MIENFVDKIINTQIEDNQFENCNITIEELNFTKKILKEKLSLAPTFNLKMMKLPKLKIKENLLLILWTVKTFQFHILELF